MRLLVVFILLFSQLSQAAGQEEDRCKKMIFPILSQTKENKDPRILGIINKIMSVANFSDSIFPCTPLKELDEPIAGVFPVAKLGRGPNSYTLLIPKILETFSDEELTGVLAHEIGHIALFVQGGDLAVKNREAHRKRELEVDAIAAGWVGNGSVLLGLKATSREYLRYYRAFQQKHDPKSNYLLERVSAYIKDELDYRFEALEKLQK
jgi:hypothetical protein